MTDIYKQGTLLKMQSKNVMNMDDYENTKSRIKDNNWQGFVASEMTLFCKFDNKIEKVRIPFSWSL